MVFASDARETWWVCFPRGEVKHGTRTVFRKWRENRKERREKKTSTGEVRTVNEKDSGAALEKPMSDDVVHVCSTTRSVRDGFHVVKAGFACNSHG